ncbi:MAG: tetratricopeptide repeat protein [Jatrophihabitantaceae bacterium]
MARGAVARWLPRRADSGGLLSAAAVLAVVAVLIARWHGPSWVLLVLALLAAVGAVALERWRGGAVRHDELAAVVNRVSTIPARSGELPTVNQLGPRDFRVGPSTLRLGYLKRDAHERLRAELVDGGPVLVIGHSMAGKTRMAYEVIRQLYADWSALIPAATDDFHDLLAEATLPQHVVWLDDLERYLTLTKPVDVAMVNRLAESGCRVVATIRSSEYDKFRPVGDVKPPQWEVLQRFAHIDLRDEQDEQDRLADHVDDPHIADGIRRYGIGEYLGGGYLALDRYDKAGTSRPLAIAMLHAAADWRHLGFDAIPEPTLLRLAPDYLTDKQQRGTRDTAAAALDWACEHFAGLQLLEATPAGWRLFDFLLDHITTQRQSVPDATWQAALEAAADHPTVALTLGFRAYQTSRPPIAAAALQLAIDSGHPDHAPMAAFNLGVLREEQGDLPGAAAAYQLAIDSGHPDHAPKAARNLGLLRQQQGDLPGAAAALQLAIDSGHPDQAPMAAVNLGLLRQEQGDLPGAAAAYQLAIDSAHPDHAPMAAVNLALLRRQQGDLPGAAAALQLAIDSGHPDQAPKAAFNLGLLRQEQDDLPGAAAAWQLAIDSGHPDHAPMAAFNLGLLRQEQDDLPGAAAAYQLAIDSGHPDAAPMAARNLGVLREERGDLPGAAATYQLAIDSGHPDQAPMAARNLGLLRQQQGDLPAAAAAYQLAIDSGHSDQAPMAAVNLGVLREGQGDLPGAAAAYQLAIDSGHPDLAPKAAFNLGLLREAQGDLPGAAAAYQLAIDSGHPEAAPMAARNLDALREERGDLPGAGGPRVG